MRYERICTLLLALFLSCRGTEALHYNPPVLPQAPLQVPDLPSHPEEKPGEAEEIVDLVNKERAKHGLSPLKMNPLLKTCAQKYAEKMAAAGQLSHFLGGDPWKRIEAEGYRYKAAGENIAWNFNGAEDVMRGWMSSPGHRANILSRSYTEIGVGIAKNKRGENYHCQSFGSPAMGGSHEGSLSARREEEGHVPPVQEREAWRFPGGISKDRGRPDE